MLLSLLIGLVVLGVVLYLVETLPIAAPIKTVARVLVALIALIWLLQLLGALPGGFGR